MGTTRGVIFLLYAEVNKDPWRARRIAGTYVAVARRIDKQSPLVEAV